MGHRPEEVRIAGGAARSRALRRILASVLNAPVRTCAREEAGAAGAAMMAAVALGVFPDIAATCRAWVDPLLGDAEMPEAQLARLEALRARLEAYAHNSSQDRRHLLTDEQRRAADEASRVLGREPRRD